MKVIKCDTEQLNSVVQLHLQSFEGFFLSRLGPAFLEELYCAFANNNDACCFVLLDKAGAVTGFISGTSSPQSFFKRLLMLRWWRFCLASVFALLRNPVEMSTRLMKAVVYRGDNSPALSGKPALLSSVAVLPGKQNKGAGKLLVAAFEKWAQTQGCDGVYLLTDAVFNDTVNSFYLRNGFMVKDVIIRSNNRKMNLFYKEVK
ncbi:GNAT family N-acetyltransferase [Halodesulfovibrio aestuarii]|uniref:GNAT family N-acetyltransferase n=1 Tax=Halodesulfovibrio aestuarii TaxID=126333 RepID=UPI000402346E